MDGFLSSIKHRTHNLWNIYMVTTVEINTDRGVMIHQISTINEWIPICGYDEQHKKNGYLKVYCKKSEGSCSQISGPFVPTPEPKH